ncbi:uncharacterized protein LOC119576697 [Penaeus monodon]|uniref:uncharacterized protein LOC119576697 n=1 Tax=Penaeus monodon TaxID=6687 RepID=UPI0018A70358|nr:uncharacterized protein LOC119576697 [Penaeus monodon]
MFPSAGDPTVAVGGSAQPFFLAQGMRGQLSIGSADAFLSEDLDYSTIVPESTQSAEPVVSTVSLVDESPLPDFEDDIAGDERTATVSSLPEGEISSQIGTVEYSDFPSDFSMKMLEGKDGNASEVVLSSLSHIIPSEVPSPTLLELEPTVLVTRPTEVVRSLADSGLVSQIVSSEEPISSTEIEPSELVRGQLKCFMLLLIQR